MGPKLDFNKGRFAMLSNQEIGSSPVLSFSPKSRGSRDLSEIVETQEFPQDESQMENSKLITRKEESK